MQDVDREYSKLYDAVIFKMIESMSPLIIEAIKESGIYLAEDFKIIYGEYLMMSDVCIKTAVMYQKEIVYKGIKLWNRESGINVTYYAAILEELECMSDQTQYNSVGNRIVRLVLDADKIGSNVVFKIKGYDGAGFIGRLDFVESILRRDSVG